MKNRRFSGWSLSLLGVFIMGCQGNFVGSKTTLPLGAVNIELDVTKGSLAPELEETRRRVEAVGRTLSQFAAGEKDVVLEFDLIGDPNPICYHTKEGHIVISQGAVSRCTSDAELAALLALEIADWRMTKKTGASTRRRPTTSLPSVGPDDQAREMALAHKEQATAPSTEPAPASDPSAVSAAATSLLSKAGYREIELGTLRTRILAPDNGPAKK